MIWLFLLLSLTANAILVCMHLWCRAQHTETPVDMLHVVNLESKNTELNEELQWTRQYFANGGNLNVEDHPSAVGQHVQQQLQLGGWQGLTSCGCKTCMAVYEMKKLIG